MNLERAIEIACKAHYGQKDKGGNIYILHPLRVMFSERNLDDDYRIVAVLHDVIEDTEIELVDLKEEGFSDEILDAIDSITHRKNESRYDYIKRVKKNEMARVVKCADIEDNMNLSRLSKITQRDLDRNEIYKEDLNYLEEV